MLDLVPIAFNGNVKHRVEFSRGSVEYVLSKPDPKAVPVVCFVLDISRASRENRSLDLVTSTLKQILFSGATSVSRMSFVTYDSPSIHFWDLKSATGKPKMFVSPTPETVSVPGLLSTTIDCPQSAKTLSYLLDHINDFAEQPKPNVPPQQQSASMLEHAVTAAAQLIRSHSVGGRIVLFTSSTASITGVRETEAPTPLTLTYRSLGKLCAKDGIGVDLFLFAPVSQVQRRQQDVPTLGELSRVTGGQLYRYGYGNSDNWKFNADLRRNLTRPWGCNAVLKARAGKGIYPAEYLGNYLPLGGNTKTKCASFASIDADKAIGVIFAHGNNSRFPVNGNVVFQTALLYTNGVNGALCLRVHTIMAPSSAIISTIFRSFDCDTVIGLLARKAVDAMRWSAVTPESAGDEIAKSASSALTVYKFACTRSSVADQLVLPDTLSLLPLYVSCLLKSSLLLSGVSPDLRCIAMYDIATMTPRDMLLCLYPRAFCLDSILPPTPLGSSESCPGNSDGGALPRAVKLTIDTYEISGVYMVDNGGSVVLIFVGESPDPDVTEHLFGYRDISSLSAPALTDAFSAKLQQWMTDSDAVGDDGDGSATAEILARYPVFSLIQELGRTRGHSCFGFSVVRDADIKGDPELWSQVYAEDSYRKSPSYTDFLCLIHKRINNNLSQMNHNN